MSRRIFISCVSDEFHRTQEGAFFSSYRTELAADLRLHGYQHTTQEDLLDGTGDLLELIETEVQRCDAIVHLIGQMTGGYPKGPAVERLLKKYPKFLEHRPELRASLGDIPILSYTQWELYLALHFEVKALIYFIDENAERSPFNAPTPESIEVQLQHLQRLEDDGLARRRIGDHHRLCRRVPASLNLHFDPRSRGRFREPIDEWTSYLADRLVRQEPSRPVQFENPDTARDAVLKTLASTTAYSPDQILGILEEHRAHLESHAFSGMKGESSLWDLALAYAAEGRFERAAKIAERAAYEGDENGDAESTIDAFQFAAHCYTRYYRHDLAVEAFENACRRIDRAVDPLRWAKFQRALGNYYRKSGAHKIAESPLRNALEIYVELLGAEHPSAIECRIDLATWLLEESDGFGAEVIGNFVLRTIEAWPDGKDRFLPIVLKILGTALEQQGRYDEAEYYLRGSASLNEQQRGIEHPYTLDSVNSLAILLDSKGGQEEAESLYRQTLEIRERIWGGEHPDTINSVANLAEFLRSKGAYDDAEPLCRRATEANRRVLGEEHPDTLSCINNLATLLRDKGDYVESEVLFRKVLDSSERVLGIQHPHTLLSKIGYSFLLELMGEFREADSHFHRAYQVLLKKLGETHPAVLEVKAARERLGRQQGDA